MKTKLLIFAELIIGTILIFVSIRIGTTIFDETKFVGYIGQVILIFFALFLTQVIFRTVRKNMDQ